MFILEENDEKYEYFFWKTKPIYSLCVLRPFDFAQDKDAYCERDLKKQSQFAFRQIWRKFFEIKRICEIIRFVGRKKQSQTKPIRRQNLHYPPSTRLGAK